MNYSSRNNVLTFPAAFPSANIFSGIDTPIFMNQKVQFVIENSLSMRTAPYVVQLDVVVSILYTATPHWQIKQRNTFYLAGTLNAATNPL